jgi:hypothetical protein
MNASAGTVTCGADPPDASATDSDVAVTVKVRAG